MHIIFAQQPLEKSIFLAGPTPRDAATKSWRPQALEILRGLDFDGKVFVPETVGGGLPPNTYDPQVQWEWQALNQATVVVFWVPRDVATLPGFTTNTEFGLLAASSKLLLGFPGDAQKMRYLDRLAQRYHIPVHADLAELLEAAVEKTKNPYPFNGAGAELAF
ncbi:MULTISPECIES: nucleoside 2-deoxyribosyltransferase domain-containing protein [unclassified Variovorax]|uniref:nucleoside 2-deoxyribosyltransferase domain-containing protein n=1 Tax=unclassified Variovorax TaxID=663243 RepID=UPI00076DEF77|nr:MULTISPECIES: nucleoside 2-deoxyribosyltransferase domain-containing protein [unclassified Variovorax]KWT98497.1 hypothetical protein APY03_0632 [Variovorax sp. WDL1]PNG49827.1 hypothetical protein CHC06_05408 [Variovorax sp. B2]PNG50699.1 hypothetical protein CHC07_05313 [Variovorax sp. B4]VTU42433.1 hypothetical protein H6P1_00185 [Variovorax sp. PBL-H6]VTU43943.1 hypothetical protein SRS16P1_00717 [Variovorax sp. SRS16]